MSRFSQGDRVVVARQFDNFAVGTPAVILSARDGWDNTVSGVIDDGSRRSFDSVKEEHFAPESTLGGAPVDVKDLKHDLQGFLDRVARGESLMILSDGKSLARISPA